MNNNTSPGKSPGHLSTRSYPKYADLKPLMAGRWRDFLEQQGIEAKHLVKRNGPCPTCGGTDRFSFDDRDGHGTFFCRNESPEAGDGFELFKRFRRLTSIQVLDIVGSYLGVQSGTVATASLTPFNVNESRQRATPINEGNQKKIEKCWRDSVPVQVGDVVHRYLTLYRRIALTEIPDQLRLHPRCEYWQEGKDGKPELLGTYPTMVARIESPQGEIVNVHRTYLTKYNIKAAVPQVRKLMPSSTSGSAIGGAIKLFAPVQRLGIAEGIETALACHQATDIPTWATYSAVSLESVIVPASVEEVIIFADNDSNKDCRGQRAANKLATRLYGEGRRVRIALPPTPGTDWADVVTGGPQ